MDNDDRGVGRFLSRRELIAFLGAAGAAQMFQPPAAARDLGFLQNTLPQCVVVPEQIEGPYFVDEKLNRADIRAEPGTNELKPGVPLRLTFNVSEMKASGACAPLANAQVDIWQCDASGVYSDAKDRSFNTVGQKFLRGYQRTDANGLVRFTTIFPGWYQGRAVHIHFKVRGERGHRAEGGTSVPPQRAEGGTLVPPSSSYEFTSQVYFDDALIERVHARPPYASRGKRAERNDRDSIFRNDGGKQLIVSAAETADGVDGVFSLALVVRRA